MKINQNLAVIGENVILVPYTKEHVEKYHEWMLDPELRELTASEPLSLEEEYEMQRKWQEDEDKLTFIILNRESSSSTNNIVATVHESVHDTSHMIGDVNLFVKGSAGDEDFEVEVEVMIAEKPYRRNGLALESLQLLLSFATSFTHPPSSTLPISADKLVVRISEKNAPSLALFEKLGFVVTRRVDVFEEVEMRLSTTSKKEEWIKGTVVELDRE